MEHSEIELFLKAKKQQKRERAVTLLTVGLAFLSLMFIGINQYYSLVILAGAVMGGLFINLDLGGAGTVSRAQLLSLLESLISRDPEALEYLRSRRTPH